MGSGKMDTMILFPTTGQSSAQTVVTRAASDGCHDGIGMTSAGHPNEH